MDNNVYRLSSLGLVLDHSRQQVTRQGRPQVDLGGNCRLWELLTALCKRFDSYYPITDLMSEVWGRNCLVEEGTVYGAVSDLRTRLRPLGLTIKHKKRIGYRLAELC